MAPSKLNESRQGSETIVLRADADGPGDQRALPYEGSSLRQMQVSNCKLGIRNIWDAAFKVSQAFLYA